MKGLVCLVLLTAICLGMAGVVESDMDQVYCCIRESG